MDVVLAIGIFPPCLGKGDRRWWCLELPRVGGGGAQPLAAQGEGSESRWCPGLDLLLPLGRGGIADST